MVIFDRSESQNREDLFLLRLKWGKKNYELKYKPFNSYYAKIKKDQQVSNLRFNALTLLGL